MRWPAGKTIERIITTIVFTDLGLLGLEFMVFGRAYRSIDGKYYMTLHNAVYETSHWFFVYMFWHGLSLYVIMIGAFLASLFVPWSRTKMPEPTERTREPAPLPKGLLGETAISEEINSPEIVSPKHVVLSDEEQVSARVGRHFPGRGIRVVGSRELDPAGLNEADRT